MGLGEGRGGGGRGVEELRKEWMDGEMLRSHQAGLVGEQAVRGLSMVVQAGSRYMGELEPTL